MKYRVHVTPRADEDLRADIQWMVDNRSAGFADRWYVGISEKIQSLSFMPDSYPLSRENAFTESKSRELYFGTGRRPTH